MQNDVNRILFTKKFTDKFRELIAEFYGYDLYMDFVVVPTVTGRKVLSYIPVLSYTDRDRDDIEDLLELSKENSYQIRVLNFEYSDFKVDDPVTMRVVIDGLDSEELFMKIMKSKHRKTLKSAYKKNTLKVDIGCCKKMVGDFYKIFKIIMKHHGTPAYDIKFFEFLALYFKENMLFYNFYDQNEIVASYALFIDNDLIYGSWGGVIPSYKNRLAGHYAYGTIIKDIADNKIAKVFDFGRSAYGSGGYTFKHRFGAKEYKIDIVTSNEDNLYQKYALASKIWRKLPSSITDKIGSKLCRYLVDL